MRFIQIATIYERSNKYLQGGVNINLSNTQSKVVSLMLFISMFYENINSYRQETDLQPIWGWKSAR